MADLITQVPVPNAPLIKPDRTPEKAWFDFFTTLWLRTGGSNSDASILLDGLGTTRGGMIARFATAWAEFEATVANTVPVLNPGGGTDVQLFTISQLLDLLGDDRGDILFRGATEWVVLAPVADKFLRSNGAGSDPSWEDSVANTPWTAYTPAVSTGTGTITTLGAVSGRYRQIGSVVFVSISISITTNGTGASFVVASLPVTPVNVVALSGRENNITAKMIYGSVVAGLNLTITYYDATYPGADGARLILGGSYEAA